MYKTIKENYKNFSIEYTKALKNSFYNISGIIYKNKGYREQKYFSFYLKNSFCKKINDAKTDAHAFINNLKEIPFNNSGLNNAEYMPSIYKKFKGRG
jgi:hypothetical protein